MFTRTPSRPDQTHNLWQPEESFAPSFMDRWLTPPEVERRRALVIWLLVVGFLAAVAAVGFAQAGVAPW